MTRDLATVGGLLLLLYNYPATAQSYGEATVRDNLPSVTLLSSGQSALSPLLDTAVRSRLCHFISSSKLFHLLLLPSLDSEMWLSGEATSLWDPWRGESPASGRW